MAGTELPVQGLMVILSSPSGAGKTSIARELLARHPNMRLSVSATTRAPRPQEVDGKDYYFVSPERFTGMVAAGDLLEYANVFRHSYGTPRQPVEAALAAGQDVLFDIDWQGTQQLKITMRRHLASIFVLPPSMAELHRRLVDRQSDSAEVIAHRMTKAMAEISHWGEYDYIIVNRDLEESVAAIQAIITAEKLRRSRQPQMAGFVRRLAEEVEGLGSISPKGPTS
jgi:guanylate kinase